MKSTYFIAFIVGVVGLIAGYFIGRVAVPVDAPVAVVAPGQETSPQISSTAQPPVGNPIADDLREPRAEDAARPQVASPDGFALIRQTTDSFARSHGRCRRK